MAGITHAKGMGTCFDRIKAAQDKGDRNWWAEIGLFVISVFQQAGITLKVIFALMALFQAGPASLAALITIALLTVVPWLYGVLAKLQEVKQAGIAGEVTRVKNTTKQIREKNTQVSQAKQTQKQLEGKLQKQKKP